MGRRKYVPENPTLMHRIGHRQPVKIERQKRVAKENGETIFTDRLFQVRRFAKSEVFNDVFTRKRLPLWIKK